MRTGKRWRQQGISLIEILCVMTIIAVFAVTVVASLSGGREQLSQRLFNVEKLVFFLQEDAVFNNRFNVFRVTEDSLRGLYYNGSGWVAHESVNQVSDEARYSLILGGKNVDLNQPADLIFYPDGTVSDFKLTVFFQDESKELYVDILGRVARQ